MPAANSDELFRHFAWMIRALADDPDSVQVTLVPLEDGSATIKVLAPAAEVGRIIGLRGRTARALRTLLMAAGSASKVRYTLDISALPR